MCGIIACICQSNESTYEIIHQGLSILQNRGYDSAGICTIDAKKSFICSKFASMDKISAIKQLDDKKYHSKHNNSKIGIGHTRWATHGAKTDDNAHPHIDCKNRVSLVHNGIIENYAEIKKFLLKHKYTFKSTTDTEVIANLVSYYLSINSNNIIKAIKSAECKMEGTWGIALLFSDTPDKLYVCRNGSPILVGYNENTIMVASEASGFSNYINNYLTLRNKEILSLGFNTDGEKICSLPNNSDVIHFNKFITKYQVKSVLISNIKLSPAPYKHWMRKEIMEQSDSLLRSINMGGRILDEYNVRLGGLEHKHNELLQINHLIILACGTSLHAGMIGAKYFKKLKCFKTVQTIDASEFCLDDIPNCTGKVGLLVLSQSGETKDVHRAMELVKKMDIIIISIVNVVDSLISRDADCGIYLNAGREVSVASTKSFTSQIIILIMMSIWYAQKRNKFVNQRKKMILDLRNVSLEVLCLINNLQNISPIVTKIKKCDKCFILGRDVVEPIAYEAALKIKEITYIHAEGYSGGSLKHGPFALIDNGTPIFILIIDDIFRKRMETAAEEVKARGAFVIIVTDIINYVNNNFKYIITVPRNETFSPIMTIIPFQMLSYEVSVSKGLNPDYPRHLAKCVTTD